MAKIVVWTPKRTKEILRRRLVAAKKYRKDKVEAEWIVARTCVFDATDLQQAYSPNGFIGKDTVDFDIGERIDIKYAFRNLRLIHSHMSSNPPVATARPETSDVEDRRAAKAAQQAMRWYLHVQDLHEKNDIINLDVLTTGTGISKTYFNTDAGDIEGYDAEKQEVEMSGEIQTKRVPPDFFWVDPDAKEQEEIRYTFELCPMSEEQIKSKWPDKWVKIKKVAETNRTYDPRTQTMSGVNGPDNPVNNEQAEILYNLYYYYEPGMPENGMLGRFAICTDDGSVIEYSAVSPCLAYPAPTLEDRKKAAELGTAPERGNPTAYLPYQILTDIDMPDRIYGRSSLFYVAPAQNLMANLDSATLEAMKAHGLIRLIMPEDAALAKDSLSNTSIEVISLQKGMKADDVKYMQPVGLPNTMSELRGIMRLGVDDMWGVNDNMFGQSQREQSGYQMQYAVNQGQMVRRRLFNKSIRFVRQQYKAFISNVVQHWDVPKALAVLGQESAGDVVELMGIDILGGYQIEVEYGTHLPLDPMTRRDELLKLQPLYEAAGVSKRSIASALKLADLEYVQSLGDLSRDRAKEIIDMITTMGIQVQPASRYQDHEGIMAYMLEYVNTADYDRLDAPIRALIDDHIDMRKELAAQQQAAPASNLETQPAPGVTAGVSMPAGAPAPLDIAGQPVPPGPTP